MDELSDSNRRSFFRYSFLLFIGVVDVRCRAQRLTRGRRRGRPEVELLSYINGNRSDWVGA
jgi:hypothetical protein